MQWGLGAALAIGGLLGAVMIPASKRAQQLAERDLAAAGGDTSEMSEEYRAITRRLATVGSLLSVLVLLTILFMAIKP